MTIAKMTKAESGTTIVPIMLKEELARAFHFLDLIACVCRLRFQKKQSRERWRYGSSRTKDRSTITFISLPTVHTNRHDHSGSWKRMGSGVSSIWVADLAQN